GLWRLEGDRTKVKRTAVVAAIIAIALVFVTAVARVFRALPHSAPSIVEPQHQTIDIDGVQRKALIYPNSAPAPKSGPPLVFVFHGHGGTAQFAARRFHIHELWPEAVVVYMQGLPGVQGITDPEGTRSGWQKNPGELNDRDVKFVDAALEQIEKQFKTDPNRIYGLGHSNGARFVNVLWNMRGQKFAAFCSSSGQGGLLLSKVVPRSIFIIAGKKDPLVPYDTQMLSVDIVRKVLNTDSSKATNDGYTQSLPGVNGTELLTYLHPGGHEFPDAAIPMAVEFFKRHARP
ncbi:MAG TPA: hypothetical protein VFV34_22955, partial [Blastocatellia bacterium]|nr:hypothetical protein [Blastocatellia bacterium]